MIPTYRPDEKFLRQALESVLTANVGEIQIEVVDDCSPEIDVPSMVKSIAANRVAFSRTPQNLGLAGCWNTCIERARGDWVHILHQDDYVLPGFYDILSKAAALHPELSLLATRSFFVDAKGVILSVSKRVEELEQGSRDASRFYYNTPLLCVGTAIKRNFYQLHGGFRPDLSFVLDCEMWARAISDGGGLVTPEVLSCYRVNCGSETNRLTRSAETLRDVERLNKLYAQRYSDFDPALGSERVCNMALEQFEQAVKTGDSQAAEVNRAYWKTVAPLRMRLRRYTRQIARKVLRPLV